MQKKNRRGALFSRVIYIGIVLIYLLTCLVPFLNPERFWFIAILGLGFPLLLLLLLICLVICVLLRSKWVLLALIALLASFQQISVLFAFHLKHEFNMVKPTNALRVLSWNVSSWTETYRGAPDVESSGLRNLMMDAVQIINKV